MWALAWDDPLIYTTHLCTRPSNSHSSNILASLMWALEWVRNTNIHDSVSHITTKILRARPTNIHDSVAHITVKKEFIRVIY